MGGGKGLIWVGISIRGRDDLGCRGHGLLEWKDGLKGLIWCAGFVFYRRGCIGSFSYPHDHPKLSQAFVLVLST